MIADDITRPNNILWSVDVEANGPMPWPYSMVQLGAVMIKNGVIVPESRFLGLLRPITVDTMRAFSDHVTQFPAGDAAHTQCVR